MALYQSARIFTEPQIEVTLNDEQVVVKVQENVTPIEVAITGNAMTHWGQIQGTLSNQTDLQTALDAKVPYSGATGNVNLGEYGLTSGYLQFDVTPTTYTPAVGNMGWNDQEGTIDLLLKGGSVSLPLGQKQVARVVNGTGGNVLRSNYQVVKVTGAQGQRLQVNLAQANNDLNSADTLGLIAENINNNNAGFIITSGLVENIDTTGTLQGETWTDGNILYLSGTTAGRLTNVKPQAPTHTVICGFVVYAHQNNGKIFVKVDNGYELDELHNVKINTGTLANGQVLKYNSSLQVWENNTDAAGTGTVTSIATSSPITGGTITTSGTIGISQATTSTDGYLSSTDWNTFNGKQNALTNPITGTGTTNELTYFTGSTSVGSLSTATYPSLTELSYVKGVTSAIQTQLNGKQATLTNPITGTGTSGHVAYFNGTTSLTSESNLFWDATNDRLGIGTNSPAQSLHVVGQIFTTGNSNNTNLISPTGNSVLRIANDSSSVNRKEFTIIHDYTNNRVDIQAIQQGVSFRPITINGGGGNVTIGTTTDSGFKLDVNGTTRSQNTLTVSAGGATVTGLSSFTGTTASDGGQLGSELLSASGWTSTGWTGSFATGWTHSIGNTTALTNTLAAVNGTYYQIAYTVTNRTAGSFDIAFGGVTTSGLSATGATGPQATSTGTLSITPTTDFDGTIVISIKVISASSASISLRNSGGTVTNEIRNASSNTNTFIGSNAGARTTTGTNNVGYGTNALNSNTTGNFNTAVGLNALLSNTTGVSNSATGYYTLYSNITGVNNSAFGLSALQNNSNGSYNSAFGAQALLGNTSGRTNVAFGASALSSNTTGNFNTAVGVESLLSISTSANNSALGYQAGRYAGAGTTANQTSSNSLYLGYSTRSSASGNTNEIVIGYNVVGLGSNTTVLGNSSTVTTGIYGNLLLGSTVTTGERLQVTGLSSFTGTTASDGGQLGSELLSASGWTSTGWTGDFATGWTHSTGNTTALTNTLAAVNGTYYQIAYTVTGRTAGTFSILFGGVTTSGLSATGATGPRATSTGTLSITPTTDFDGTIVISIKVISASSASISLRNSAGTVTNEIRNANSNSNIFIGLNAGSKVTTGILNALFGISAGENITTGTQNSIFGSNSGRFITTGINNSFFGLIAGENTITGSGNSFFGRASGQQNTTGSNNTAFGFESGRYAGSGTTANQTSSNSLYLGYQTRSSASGNTNEVVIGYNVVGNGSNTTTLGNSSTTGNYIYGDFNIFDAKNFILGTTTGTKIGTATSQKIGFWNATPIVQPTTAVASATRVGGGGTTLTDADTFDGYTLAQIVKALRNTGILS